MTDAVFNLRYLEESQPSICIPRVFNNIDAKKIGNVFDQLQLGKIKRIDMIECKNEKGEKFKRAFVHFEKWHWNEDAQAARRKLIEGKEIKIVYDTPWFWKISANRSNTTNDSRREEGPPATQRFKPHMELELEDEFGRSNSMRKDIPRPVSKAQVNQKDDKIPVSKAQVNQRPLGRRMDDKRDNRMRPVDVKLDVKLERKAPIAPCLSLIHPGKIAPCLPPTPPASLIPTETMTPVATAPDTPYQYHPPATDTETLTTAIDYGVKKPIPKRRITKKPVVLKAAPILKLEEGEIVGEVKEFLEVKVEDQVVEMNEADKKICEELYGDL
jgi:hypothetical protein